VRGRLHAGRQLGSGHDAAAGRQSASSRRDETARLPGRVPGATQLRDGPVSDRLEAVQQSVADLLLDRHDRQPADRRTGRLGLLPPQVRAVAGGSSLGPRGGVQALHIVARPPNLAVLLTHCGQ